ncbi:hypothetical protein HYG77_31900 (plasmid) [Rhodococcus sp. ZPP]|uniref:hypothetical protein n=1 Tax=Rhodococcus sp. ZPP TaxID=2749906 RepID=UPI001AD85CF8|nr:hypothetical protein [Rhodococcus sp. ZPP]QTJ70187.1 hypothetical protein HYG77_31900 [Rhodococcus sp. ZPP]
MSVVVIARFPVVDTAAATQSLTDNAELLDELTDGAKTLGAEHHRSPPAAVRLPWLHVYRIQYMRTPLVDASAQSDLPPRTAFDTATTDATATCSAHPGRDRRRHGTGGDKLTRSRRLVADPAL